MFYMDNSYPLINPIVVRQLDAEKDQLWPCKTKHEKLLGPEVPYLSSIGAHMYLPNNTKPDISFVVNLLPKYSSS